MRWTFQIEVNAAVADLNDDIHWMFAARGTDDLAYGSRDFAPRALYNTVVGPITAIVAPECILSGFDYKWIDGDWANLQGSVDSPYWGSQPEAPLMPFQNCVIIRRRTAAGGYSGTGRLFLSPLRDLFREEDNPNLVHDTNGWLSGMCNVLTLPFQTAWPGRTFEHVLLHGDGTADKIEDADISPYFGVRRSRRVG